MAKPNRPHPLLTIRFRQRIAGLRHKVVVDEASVAREEVGEVDTAEKEVGEEDTVVGGPTEIVVAGAVSGSSECSLIRNLTYDLDSAYRGRGDGEFRGRGEGMERKPICILFYIDSWLAFIRLPWPGGW